MALLNSIDPLNRARMRVLQESTYIKFHFKFIKIDLSFDTELLFNNTKTKFTVSSVFPLAA